MDAPRIWILPREVSEQIAAGEVVERPASAVKELVENAIDAGARRIVVETVAGGRDLIRVTDDGQGMTPEEVRLAILRHATSKLRSADDLFSIHTLGFRGEALPSIAAVSEMEVLTRTPTSDSGTRVQITAGEVLAEEPAAAPVGTTVLVRRLFFNLPVRARFLKSDNAEQGHITDWVQRLAMAHPAISFRLIHDGREALLSPGGGDALNAVTTVLGRGTARDLLPVRAQAAAQDAEDGPALSVTGYVGRPTLTRANRNLQHLYVNHRSVRSPLFYRALDDAFRSSMPGGRYPIAVVFLEIAPELVDVNVHPAKTEVRFRDEAAVSAGLTQAFRAALRAEPAPATQTPFQPVVQESPSAAEPVGPRGSGEESFALAALRPAGPARTWDRPQQTRGPLPSSGPAPGTRGAPSPAPLPASLPLQARLPAEPDPATAPAALPNLQLIGQVNDVFILAEGEGDLWVLDQHVVHERVLFDRLMARAGGHSSSELLLIPPVMDVDRLQAAALERNLAGLDELGFRFEAAGEGRYRLTGIPADLVGRDYEAVARDLVDRLAGESEGLATPLRREELAELAAGRSCKAAVKAGQRLDSSEMTRLLADLQGAENPHTCPHGRPVFLRISEQEVRQMFGPVRCMSEPRRAEQSEEGRR